ncbi:hypothetical protein C8R43DRAFT_946113 [Mycena crocata]|nr:hypothetical protein C8R43DRAFT_946113 [Mycena crocata]
MSEQEASDLTALQDLADDYDIDDTGPGWQYEQDVLHGRTQVNLTNAGDTLDEEEVQDSQSEKTLLEKLREHHNQLFPRRRDYRTRTDRTQILVDAFAEQLKFMADEYVQWSASIAESSLAAVYTQPEDAIVEGSRNVLVVDIFYVPMIRGDHLVASAFVRQGLIPVAPHWPSVVITIRALEIFRVCHLRCPRLGIQAFVRSLCDVHGVPPRAYLGFQFGVAFDVYLAIRAIVEKRVQIALGRDTPNWRLKNACPACLYKLEGEPSLLLPFLVTIDGNESLRRVLKREREQVDEDGTVRPGATKERRDNRELPNDYYLPRAEVDTWAKEGLEDMMKDFVPGEDEEDEGGGCQERWQNMKDDVTARAFGMYDETGFFPSLCRHGFVLVVVDMVQSGELGKYGFAIIAHLLRVLGELGVGYDIGCKFGKMVKAHPGLSQLAADNNLKVLVGSFHGAAHGRVCQLDNLATYIKGMGNEDLETCEKFFSKSNSLASSTRYASVFHRKQAIVNYLKHSDVCDAYQALSTVLAGKYRRALAIKQTLPALHETMRSLGVESRDVFATWIAREKEVLRTLSKEPLEETLQMEYYQKLVNLLDQEERLATILQVGMPAPGEEEWSYDPSVKETRRLETQRRHALEVHAKTLDAVHDLEFRLGIEERWVRGDAHWVAAALLSNERRYQRAIDHLESLIIARMFELTKVHMAGTGYKLRKHIAKALQARSKAVKAAITRYNDAAEAHIPQRPTLSWEQVVEYAFLSDFDLLRLGREDIRQELWATPGGRAAMDQHFKIERSDEEIMRLDVEIRRFVTLMVDEEAFLIYHQDRLEREGDPGLAHQVFLHRRERGRYNAVHMERLGKLSKVPGCTASLLPGVAVCKERAVPREEPAGDAEMEDVGAAMYNAAAGALPPTFMTPRVPPRTPSGSDAEDSDSSDDEAQEGDVDGDDAATESFVQIMHIADDGTDTAAAAQFNSLTL